MAATISAELVRVDEPLNFTERAAIAGFLAGYTGNTLVSYTTDPRLLAEWCTNNDLHLLDVRRAHLADWRSHRHLGRRTHGGAEGT